MHFDPQQLLSHLPGVVPKGGYWVALSGGLDSTVLLHALAQLRLSLPASLGAVHVHHGLQTAADAWVTHCQDLCTQLAVPLVVLHADARPDPGESPEARARQARYAVLQNWLPTHGLLLAAHHQDDQAETFLLQLLRGAGPRGLSAMPVTATLGAGQLLRPLLPWGRHELQAYAEAEQLRWVEDPSNADIRFERNFLRREWLPRLQARWPAASRVIARSAALCADAVQLQDDLAALDLHASTGRLPDSLQIPALLLLSAIRQRNLLRFWLQKQGFRPPARKVLQRILDEVLASRDDAQPCVHWPGVEVRRFAQQLLVMQPLEALEREDLPDWDPLNTPVLTLPWGSLRAEKSPGSGLRVCPGQRFQLRTRKGGEKLQLPGRAHHHSLKHLFQEWGIPPWERDRWPLMFADADLAAVPGLAVAAPFLARNDQPGCELHWSRLVLRPH